MCTVTIVAHDGGFRLVCNRDERLDRSPALRPAIRAWGNRTGTFPIDPTSGGTWIGVNDLGVTAALLNRTADPIANRRRALLSRGAIVPRLLACGSWLDAMRVVAALDPTSFEPFRLVVAQERAPVGEWVGDGLVLSSQAALLTTPRLFTSSSLGDQRVDGPRRDLFHQLLADDEAGWLRAQFRFHRHRWTSALELSVEMERADAATVSRTTIDVGAGGIHLSYEALAGKAVRYGLVA